jgi:hypothetical protein
LVLDAIRSCYAKTDGNFDKTKPLKFEYTLTFCNESVGAIGLPNTGADIWFADTSSMLDCLEIISSKPANLIKNDSLSL